MVRIPPGANRRRIEESAAKFYIGFAAGSLFLTSPTMFMTIGLIGFLVPAILIWLACAGYSCYLAIYFSRRPTSRAAIRVLSVLALAHLAVGIAYPGSLPMAGFDSERLPFTGVQFFLFLGWIGTALAMVVLGMVAVLRPVSDRPAPVSDERYRAAQHELAEISKRNSGSIDLQTEDGKRAAFLMRYMREFENKGVEESAGESDHGIRS